MGCLQSKNEISDLHPNVFRVVNTDENGSDLCTGLLEINDSSIILYREGRDCTVWPLHSLRRYGFEGEIFSFESGRRCDTGEGIYAFRCRRAPILFQNLQRQIQLLNDTVPYPVSRTTPSPQRRQTLQASVVHRSSLDNGQPDNRITPGDPAMMTQSPHSPSSAHIHEVMPLYPRTQAGNNHGTNVYQVRDFKREHNNNQAESTVDNRHVYTNDLNRDLALLRNSLRQETALNTRKNINEDKRFFESRFVMENTTSNLAGSHLSTTRINSSEHYAQLNTDQQEQQQQISRLYVNIATNDAAVLDAIKNDTIPSTPVTPKQVEYANLSIGMKTEVNSYANLMLGDKTDSGMINKQFFNTVDAQRNSQKFSESDTIMSMSPIEEMEVNYAVLDMDSNKETIKVPRDLASPESQSYNSSKQESTASGSSQPRVEPAIGYTTIDFDKTVALTTVAAGAEASADGGRKNRHNSSSFLSGSPATAETSRGSK